MPQQVPEPPAGRRPNTQAPETLLSVSSEDLVALTDAELIKFADETLGIVIPLDTSRTVILAKIINAAAATK